jgi:hypothetical protein
VTTILVPDDGLAWVIHEGWPQPIQRREGVEYEVSVCVKVCWEKLPLKDKKLFQQQTHLKGLDIREILASHCGCQRAVPLPGDVSV